MPYSGAMLRPDLVRRKLAFIVDDLHLLRRFEALTYDALLEDPVRLAAIERLIERIVNRAVDANAHLLASLSETDHPIGRLTYKQTFLRLPDIGALPEPLAIALSASAGLRNVLVHEYNDVEHRYLHESIRRCLTEYPKYVDALLSFLELAEDSHE